ncbi:MULTISPECIES: GUN4 domain-containing protein [unclassified Nostoc]|uniref:GUN4 domain-containing protein n=1 Tax=unclassified Nostoc TaxID=2593658 RepID=UPI002AD24DDF|nr:GUN4 domain-containing protein [Nostoc sp. DedQUE03]MDZ7973131.1 GUN4 domain-containing protein [Nostoc sp. DedQUE03]MDZ8047912.1 GUN4 domain-containing protein [Nostoc sp. DedQUE02]
MIEETKAPTKVFISYSWDSEEHQERVLALANTLRNPWGIETDIDQYIRAKSPFTPSQGWDLWMEKRIEWAEFVLIVCTETYKRRFRGDEEPGIGRGSTWEGTIIRQHLYNNQLVSTKFIPVVFSPQDLTHVPIIFNGNDKYILEDEKSFGELCYRLRKEPIVAMPEIATAKLQAPPEPKFFSPQKSQAEPPTVFLDIAEIQYQTAFKPEEEPQKPSINIEISDCIRSENLLKLEELLKTEKIKEADEQTKRLILMENQNNPLTAPEIRQIPLDLLGSIDRLWMEYSAGKFGLKVQQQMWQKIQEPEKPRFKLFAKKVEPLTESQIWNRLGCLVGWRSDDEKILSDAKLDFSIKAPLGCFPRTRLWLRGGHGNNVKQFAALMDRVAQLE